MPRWLRPQVEAVRGDEQRELSVRGITASATVLDVRPRGRGPDCVFRVRVRVPGRRPYEARLRQQVRTADLERMRPGEVIRCRVDPDDPDRVMLYPPGTAAADRTDIAKILMDGRRAEATVLAATPVAADYSGGGDPLLRLDLELRTWDEPKPWRVRLVQSVPLAAIDLVDLGAHLKVAFFAVDHGESVAVDWAATLRER